MPSLDLTGPDGGLVPLAPFEVLAVMLAPSDKAYRARVIAHIEKDTGLVPSRRPRLSGPDVLASVAPLRAQGALGGELLLYLLQIHREIGRVSLNLAIGIVRTAIPAHPEVSGAEWHEQRHRERLARDPRRLLSAFRSYQSVAHLWAAFMYADSYGRPDLRPDSNETLPGFLGLAEAIAGACEGLYLHRTSGPAARAKDPLLPAGRWTFVSPPGLRRAVPFALRPLSGPALTIVREGNGKPLKRNKN